MAEPKPVRLAFVGAGNHSTAALYPNLPLIAGCELVGVCDMQAERAERVARAYGAEPFSDCAAMLDALTPDAVCACGMPDMHHSVALQVLERGIPVWIEKPPAPTLKQSEELAATARRAGTFGMVGFMKRFAPANVVTKEYIDSGRFGALASVLLVHGSGPYGHLRPMLMFNGIHPIDSLRYFGGDVEAVHAFAHASADGVQSVVANLRLASGVPAQLNLNSGGTWSDCYEYTYLAGHEAQATIVGCREVEIMSPAGRFAQASSIAPFGWSNRYYVSGTMSHWEAGGHYTRGYFGELDHFVRAVRGEVEPVATLADGVEAMRLIDAIIASIEGRREVLLSEVV